jgi:hypothetical protein
LALPDITAPAPVQAGGPCHYLVGAPARSAQSGEFWDIVGVREVNGMSYHLLANHLLANHLLAKREVVSCALKAVGGLGAG